MAIVTKHKLPVDAAYPGIGEVAYQLLDCAWGDLRPDVNKEDHLCSGFRNSNIDGDRLAAMLLEYPRFDPRIALAGQQLCCSVRRAIRNNDDFLKIGVVQVKQVLNLFTEQSDAIMDCQDNAHTRTFGAGLPGSRP